MNINIIIYSIMMLEHEECYHIDDFEYDDDNNNNDNDNNEYAGFLHVSRTYGKSGKRFLYKVVPYNRELPQSSNRPLHASTRSKRRTLSSITVSGTSPASTALRKADPQT